MNFDRFNLCTDLTYVQPYKLLPHNLCTDLTYVQPYKFFTM